MAADKAGRDIPISPGKAMTAEKKQIRRMMLARRDALTSQEQQRASCLITERLLGHQWFYRAKNLLCYVSYGSELNTRELIMEALRLGKQVYVPKVGENRRMDFFQISSLEELQPGFHGILEPLNLAHIYMGGQDQTLMLMPGVAFDMFGNRLGYGGGYYDRYLAAHPQFQTRLSQRETDCFESADSNVREYSAQAYTIAIGHRCQMVEALPVEETDYRPCQVILV